MRHLTSPKLFTVALLSMLTVLGFSPAGAASANISHSYHPNGSIQNGSLVSLDAQQSDYVEPSNTDNSRRLLGVAVANNDSLLAVNPGAGLVQVATSGNANTLVSTLNGAIKVGDKIAVSPLSGVGMKSQSGAQVIGLAQTDFNQTTSGASPQTVSVGSGKSSQVYVGYVQVNVAVGTDTSSAEGTQGNGLQRLGHSISGHNVSAVRVLVSLVIAVVALVSLIVLIYASIFGSIISVGRNPLAKYAVFRTLTAVVIMIFVLALIAGVTIFLLLQ